MPCATLGSAARLRVWSGHGLGMRGALLPEHDRDEGDDEDGDRAELARPLLRKDSNQDCDAPMDPRTVPSGPRTTGARRPPRRGRPSPEAKARMRSGRRNELSSRRPD